MSSNRTFPQQQQQPDSEEEIVFSGRSSRKRPSKKERMPRRTSISDSRPSPLPYRPGSGGSNYRDERGNRSRSGGVALPPRPKTPERWENSYRTDSRGGRYDDAGRESQGWYEDFGRVPRSDSYRAPGYENMGYRDAGPARSLPERDVRSYRRSYRDHANTSAGGEALRSQIGTIYGSGANTSRNDHYGNQYRNQPQPIQDEREHSYSSFHNAPSTHQPYERYQASERAYPLPPGDRPTSLPQRHSGEPSYGSDHRQPSLSSRGLPSSSRFNKGIDKRSRYSPPASSPNFSTTAAAAAADKRSSKLAKKARRREAALLNPTPPTPPTLHIPHIPYIPRCTTPSPAHAHIPPSTTILPIPKPTSSYLGISLLPSPRLAAPTRHLIILDLNGTLLARAKGKAKSGSLNPTPRPGLALFLTYVFARFNVMVWSSAQPENVRLMVRALFSDSQKRALLACWGRDTLGLTKKQFTTKTQVYKRLERVWTGDYRVLHHTEEGQWDQMNTVLLDDSPAKARGQPWNHVEVPEFLGTAIEKKEDRALWALAGYLEECRWRGNVSAFIRGTPFKVGGEWETTGEEVLGEFEGRGGEAD